jgi:hypothetical protein
MNDEKRKRLGKIITTLNDSMSKLEKLKEDEQSALDNLPPGIQKSHQAADISDVIVTLDDIIIDLSDVIQRLDDIG